jgi:ubiquitin-protein ligase
MSTISKESVHRLLSDVREIMKHPLHDNGIYYAHDETDMLRGWAMIIGPDDTPYFGGFYFFKFQFPTDYPYSPPVVTCHTNDGRTRFNPNLYINGKVCISILNTWRGEPWSSCQTISTVLLTLCTIFCKNPILNEPGLKLDNPDSKPYNEILEYMNIKVAICDMVEKSREKRMGWFTSQFAEAIEEQFTKNYNSVLAFLETKKHIEPYICGTRIYGMREKIDYSSLYARFKEGNKGSS